MAIAIGTSGWSYPTGFGKWRGVFYPTRWHGDELAYYAERFPAVEINTSFYRLPSRETVRGWGQRTPKHFRFTVKLFRKFTHPDFYAREEGQSPVITDEDVAAMRGILDVLAEQGKLGALLLQYPEFFHKSAATVSSLTRVLSLFSAYPLAVELRHASWGDLHTRELLANVHAARVHIDDPVFRNLDGDDSLDTSCLYWRFHGRNKAEWQRPGAGNHRYDYLYSATEIEELATAIYRRPVTSRDTFVFFNNHVHGQAVANAIALAKRLDIALPFEKFSSVAERFPELKTITGNAGGQLFLLD